MKKTPSWADDQAFGRNTRYSSERAQRAVDVNWIRNADGNWYLLDELPRTLPSMRCDGIYILWYFDESHAPQTVRVGIKAVNDHLGMMRKDPEVEKYAEHPLYITWAAVKSSSLDGLIGIWSYLCKELEPLVGPRCPQVDATRVVLPWAPIKEASGASAVKHPPTSPERAETEETPQETPQEQEAPVDRGALRRQRAAEKRRARREAAAADPAARGETRPVWYSEEPTLQQQEASGASAVKQTLTSGPNPQQQEAIQITEGPLLIIAGPGSGKTFTLVERIYHLISEHDIPPERLFVSTLCRIRKTEYCQPTRKFLCQNTQSIGSTTTPKSAIGLMNGCNLFMEDYLDSKSEDFDGIAAKRFLLGQAREQVSWYRQSIDALDFVGCVACRSALETGQTFTVRISRIG